MGSKSAKEKMGSVRGIGRVLSEPLDKLGASRRIDIEYRRM